MTPLANRIGMALQNPAMGAGMGWGDPSAGGNIVRPITPPPGGNQMMAMSLPNEGNMPIEPGILSGNLNRAGDPSGIGPMPWNPQTTGQQMPATPNPNDPASLTIFPGATRAPGGIDRSGLSMTGNPGAVDWMNLPNNFMPVPGEQMLPGAGTFLGYNPANGRPVYQPWGKVDTRQPSVQTASGGNVGGGGAAISLAQKLDNARKMTALL